MSASLGPFAVHDRLGRGGMAQVWAGVHTLSATPVAIKVMTGDLARALRYRIEFAREVRAVARLDHPAVVRIFDHGAVPPETASAVGMPAGAPFLVMERLDGGGLGHSSALRRWSDLSASLLTILDGLAHAHARGVIHRDLKPDNVLFGERGPVITDFGLAFDARTARAEGSAAGTPGFMAPEQIRNDWRRFGPPTDLYAVGCIGWALATHGILHAEPGRSALAIAMQHLNAPLPAFRARLDVPPAFEGWLRSLLAREPEDRPAFAADAAATLRRVIDGRSGEVRVHAPDWRAKQRAPRPTRLVGVGRALFGHRIWPPVGREPARDRLWDALMTVHGGRGPRAVILDGPSGYGKSHLADWLAERAHEAGLATALTALHEPGNGTMNGINRMLARHFRCVDDDPSVALPAIGALAGLDCPPLEVAALIAPDGRCSDGQTTIKLSGRAERLAALVSTLRALSHDRPLVLTLDDAQWGPAALSTIDGILDAGLPILLLLTVRTDAVTRGSAVERTLRAIEARDEVETISVGPLKRDDHRRMIRAMLPVDETLADALVERAAGSPLFAVELLRCFIGTGRLRDGPRGYRLTAGAADELPRGLEAVWRTRLAGALGETVDATMPALEVASTLGLIVNPDEWRAVCDRDEMPWPAAGLERLLDARLMRIDHDGRWAFCHAMLRETIQAILRAAGRWRRVNGLCADTLAAIPGMPPGRVAGHLIAAERLRDALDPLTRAGESHQLNSETDALERNVSAHIGVLRRMRLPPDDRAWQQVRIMSCHAALRRARYMRVKRRSKRVSARARAMGHVHDEAIGLYLESNAVYYTDGPEDSIGLIDAAVACGRRMDDPAYLSFLLSEMGSTAMFLGDLDRAEGALREALDLLRDLDAPHREGTALYYLAAAAAFREHPDEGIALCRAARSRFRVSGSRHFASVTYSVESDLQRRAGRLDLAEFANQRFTEDLRFRGIGERAYIELNQALVLLARSRFDEALRGLDAAAALELNTQTAAIAAARWACAAGAGDWVTWARLAVDLEAVVTSAPCSPDVPWAADLVAGIADGHGRATEAAFARRIAAAHRARLNGAHLID